MKKLYIALSAVTIVFFASCKEKDTTFLITENQIGPLLKKSPVSEIETIFSNDSIVQDSLKTQLTSSLRKIDIYEKGGKHLLTLTPNQDSIPTIENIRIFDSRYVSEKGIGLQSTFKDIKTHHEIKKIVTTLNSVVVFPKESNLYFTLDKNDLPASLRYTSSNIEAVQIPDETKIKYLMMGWD